MSVSGERDHWKKPSKYLETWELKHAKLCWGKFFSKADHLKRKNQQGTSWQRAKEQRLVFIHSLVHLAGKALAVWLLAAASRFLIQFWSEIEEPAQVPSQWQYKISAQHSTGHTVFTGHHGGHFLCVKREALVTSNRAISNIAIF